MNKRILSFAMLLTFGLLFTACHDESSKQGIPSKDEAKDTKAMTADDHDGHDHDGTEADGHEHGTDMEAMDSKGTDLGFEEGSWGWSLQDYFNNGSTESQTFTLDEVAYDGDELSDLGEKQLDDLATFLKAHPDNGIILRCHSREASNAAGRAAKMTGTKVRAVWVQEKLKARGADGKQIDAKGVADSYLVEGIDGKDDAQNRITIEVKK
jgi:outer membrane protein OmpA-like peptidoglycan-associated protein